MAYIDRLQKDLAGCVQAGILGLEQAERVAAHIAENQAASRIRGVTWIAIFAGLSIAVGVVLVVSHNWENIPAGAKMAGFLMLLTSAGAATLATRERGPAVNVPLEVLWFFLPLVGIGLYAQIFQLSGDPVKPYLVWLALTLPVAALSPHQVTPTLHVAGLLAVLWHGSFSRGGLLTMLEPRASALLLAPTILAIAAVEAKRRLKPEHQVAAAGAALAWILGMLLGPTPLRVREPGLIFAAAAALSVLWLAAAVSITSDENPRNMPRSAWLAAFYIGTFLWHEKGNHSSAGQTEAGLALVVALAVTAAAAVILLPGHVLSRDERRVIWAKVLLAGSLALPFAAAWNAPIVGLACNLVLVAAAVGLMWNGSVEGRASQINAGVAVLFLLIITRFVDVFGTLLQGGVAFIAAGLVLAGLAYVLHKGRQTLLERAREAA